MFTTGSKYFFGITGLSAVALLVYLLFVNPNDIGAAALFGALAGSALVGGLTIFTRDHDAATAEEAVTAAAEPVQSGFWPIVVALGVGVLLLGLVSTPVVFVLGLAALVVGGAEWIIADWAERASSDNAYNRFVRERALSPLEFPVLAAVGVAVMGYSFSRIMLAVNDKGAPIIFIVVAAGILLVGSFAAFNPSFRGKVLATIATLAAVVLVLAGITGGLVGERKELAEVSHNKPYTNISHTACTAARDPFFDKKTNQSVDLKSAVIATVTVKDGKVTAQGIGLNQDVSSILVPRSNYVNIKFNNNDSNDYRLVANLGKKVDANTKLATAVQSCTQLTSNGHSQLLTISIPKPSIAGGPYTLTVPGATGEIELMVP